MGVKTEYLPFIFHNALNNSDYTASDVRTTMDIIITIIYYYYYFSSLFHPSVLRVTYRLATGRHSASYFAIK